MSLPTVIGLCSDERCAEEFYLPDPKPGEKCPCCDRKLVHYRRTTYRVTPSKRDGKVIDRPVPAERPSGASPTPPPPIWP